MVAAIQSVFTTRADDHQRHEDDKDPVPWCAQCRMSVVDPPEWWKKHQTQFYIQPEPVEETEESV